MSTMAGYEAAAVNKKGELFVGASIFSPPYNWDTLFTGFSNRELFLAKITPKGELAWERTFGGDANYVLTSVNTDSAGNCIAMGSYYDWQNNPDGKRKIFILKLSPEGEVITSTHEALTEPQTQPRLYPNPAGHAVRVRWPGLKTGYTYEIYDALGKRVLHGESPTGEAAIDVSALSMGVYSVRVQSKLGTHTLRLVRE